MRTTFFLPATVYGAQFSGAEETDESVLLG